MKFTFDATSDHQVIPVDRVCRVAAAAIYRMPRAANGNIGLFSSQEEAHIDPDRALEMINTIRGDDSDLPSELDKIEQLQREECHGAELDLSIDMETGTGKTYTYLRTIFALSEQNSLNAFIIVVPSVAVREGVLKTIEQTREHFASLYGGRRLAAFVYAGGRPGAVRNFGNGGGIDVMVITLDSFNKDGNVLRRTGEDGLGASLIDYLAAARPVVILDEPQNMESDKSQEAIDLLKPLMTLRYSATHRSVVNLIYRLSPARAREAGLVKSVEVVSMEEAGVRDRAYVRVKKITDTKTSFAAEIEIECVLEGVLKRKTVRIGLNSMDERKKDLFLLSGRRPVYRDRWIVTAIDKTSVTFDNGQRVGVNEELGVHRESMFRAQIRLTIESHIEKIKQARQHNVKVLSLFFIDKVASWVDADGIVRRIFAEEFENAKMRDDFPEEWRHLSAGDVTEGYFASKPKKDGSAEILDTSGRQGDADAEKRAFDLIMKGKEDLLTFPIPSDDTKTRRRRQIAFIFSHSALREGWDNPNVFTICTLAEGKSVIRKRQEIGRGVRLPVNQDGHRIQDDDLNVLAVVANQSYEAFVIDYQKECAAFGGDKDNAPRRRRKKTLIKVQADVAIDEDFLELWKRASRKTMWTVQLDSQAIIKKVKARLGEIDDQVKSPVIRTVRSRLETDKSGVEIVKTMSDNSGAMSASMVPVLPDVIELVSNALCREKNRLALTSRTIAEICADPLAVSGILRNAVQWSSRAAQVIRDIVEAEAIDGIKYEQTGDVWSVTKLTQHDREVVAETVDAGPRGLYDKVAVDSDPEKKIVAALRDRSEKGGDVLIHFKLPPWFKIMTPVGTYNPDFAIVKQERESDLKTIYMVREVKGAIADGVTPEFSTDESRKIRCAREHFNVSAEGNIDYAVIGHPSAI